MAVVQIPMGGGMMGIDVPDFAMEATQQDLLSYTQQQVNILNAIADNTGATVSSIQNTSQQSIANANKNTQQQTTTFLGGVKNILGAGMNKIVSTAASIEQDTQASQFTEKLFATMNLPGLGAGMGSVIGIVEEFANQMGNLNRIGAGLGQNFIQLRDDAANIGLGLDQFTQIVGNSGAMIGSLGANTEEGSNRFIKFTAALRSATKDAGYFGMTSAEMAQFTADELDLRRQMYDTEYNRNLNEKDLAQQLKENLTLQSAMARINGQDVRDRIKAQQDFQRDAINAGIMASLTKEQQESLKSATGGLSQLGSGGAMITEGLRNMMADMPAEMAPGFAEFAAMLSSQGIDVKGAMSEIDSMIETGADPAAIAAAVDALAGQVKNIDPASMTKLAIGGVEGAQAVLQTRMETVASGAETMVDSTAKINTAMDDFGKAVESGALRIQGAAANVEEFMAESKALAVNSILESVGIDVTNIEAFQTGFAGLSESLTNLPDNEKFRELVSAAISAAFKLNGTTAVTGLLLDSQGVDRTTGEAERVAEASMLGSLAASAAGLEKFAAILASPMQGIVALDTLDSAGKITGIQALSDTADVVRSSLDGLVLSIEAATEAIYDSFTNLETAHHSTGSN